jgi:hypothetical protein
MHLEATEFFSNSSTLYFKELGIQVNSARLSYLDIQTNPKHLKNRGFRIVLGYSVWKEPKCFFGPTRHTEATRGTNRDDRF